MTKQAKINALVRGTRAHVNDALRHKGETLGELVARLEANAIGEYAIAQDLAHADGFTWPDLCDGLRVTRVEIDGAAGVLPKLT